MYLKGVCFIFQYFICNVMCWIHSNALVSGFECTMCKCNIFEYHNMSKYNNAKYTFKCESNIYENIKLKYSLLISYVTGSKITTQQNLKNPTQLYK
jgi:hypothetical protein